MGGYRGDVSILLDAGGKYNVCGLCHVVPSFGWILRRRLDSAGGDIIEFSICFVCGAPVIIRVYSFGDSSTMRLEDSRFDTFAENV